MNNNVASWRWRTFPAARAGRAYRPAGSRGATGTRGPTGTTGPTGATGSGTTEISEDLYVTVNGDQTITGVKTFGDMDDGSIVRFGFATHETVTGYANGVSDADHQYVYITGINERPFLDEDVVTPLGFRLVADVLMLWSSDSGATSSFSSFRVQLIHGGSTDDLSFVDNPPPLDRDALQLLTLSPNTYIIALAVPASWQVKFNTTIT